MNTRVLASEFMLTLSLLVPSTASFGAQGQSDFRNQRQNFVYDLDRLATARQGKAGLFGIFFGPEAWPSEIAGLQHRHHPNVLSPSHGNTLSILGNVLSVLLTHGTGGGTSDDMSFLQRAADIHTGTISHTHQIHNNLDMTMTVGYAGMQLDTRKSVWKNITHISQPGSQKNEAAKAFLMFRYVF
jgi:hypothetical protein